MEVVYDGIRLTAEAIVAAAAEKRVHVVGLSILSGSHMPLVQDVVARMKEAGLDDVPVVVGGIIPPQDASVLKSAGVAEVYTPKDFELNRIMSDLVRIVEGAAVRMTIDPLFGLIERFKRALATSFETMMAGRIFWISPPIEGSKSTHQTSPFRIGLIRAQCVADQAVEPRLVLRFYFH